MYLTNKFTTLSRYYKTPQKKGILGYHNGLHCLEHTAYKPRGQITKSVPWKSLELPQHPGHTGLARFLEQRKQIFSSLSQIFKAIEKTKRANRAKGDFQTQLTKSGIPLPSPNLLMHFRKSH